jgi:pyruvate kinase
MVGMFPVTAVAMMKKIYKKIEQTFRDMLSSGQS